MFRKKKYKSLDLVVIDYMQLIDPTERGNNREREVAEISRALKKMSLEFEIPIMLSQLNRSASNKRPTLDTLRESGAIEDADNVILLHKPDESDIDPNDLSLYRTLKTEGRDGSHYTSNEMDLQAYLTCHIYRNTSSLYQYQGGVTNVHFRIQPTTRPPAQGRTVPR